MPIQTISAYGISACWLIFVLYWVSSARNVKPATRTESPWMRFGVYGLPLIVAVVLVSPAPWFGGPLRERFVPAGDATSVAALACAVAGLALAIWARRILGRNWSGVVQLKEDHELIERGPYRLIRHPIYTALILMFVGSALRSGEWRGPLAVAIVGLSFWRKLKVEERWLTELFGERYREYRRRTKALIPYLL